MTVTAGWPLDRLVKALAKSGWDVFTGRQGGGTVSTTTSQTIKEHPMSNREFLHVTEAAKHFGITCVDFRKEARRQGFDLGAHYLIKDWADVAARFGK